MDGIVAKLKHVLGLTPHEHTWGPWLRSTYTVHTHWRDCLCGARETKCQDSLLTPEMVELFIEQRSATVGRLLPSAADLDAVAEEQRIKELTR